MKRMLVTLSTGLAMALSLATVGSAADAPALVDTGRLSLQDYRTRGRSDDRQTDWEIHGQDAQLDGPLANLKTVEVTFRTADGETFLITSPGCAFNRGTKVGSSEEEINVRSRRVTVDGVGYDIFAGQQKLHIRSRAVMHIVRDEEQRGFPLDLPGLRPGGNKNAKTGSKPVAGSGASSGVAPDAAQPPAK